MGQQWPAGEIARLILDGFDDYREHFRQITDGARVRFEQAQWQDAQQTGLLVAQNNVIAPTLKGQRFLNEVLERFLP